ncbi:MAG: cytochrome c biogenesis protein CcsA [Bdellovibrionales bacterium]|nr:cytochrome c biogenesis protein CcsA [Bdellovibrionales bacterium]
MKLIFVIILPMISWNVSADVIDPLKKIPVQDLGRLKPFDTFARESLYLVYGKKTYTPPEDLEQKDKDKKPKTRSATDVVFTWMLIPTYWDEQEIIEIRHSGLREALKLTNGHKIRFSPKELFLNERMSLLFQELKNQQTAQNKLNPYYQAVQRLQNQMAVYHMIKTGHGLHVVPQPDSDTWLSVAELQGPLAEKFSEITRAIVGAVSQNEDNKEANISSTQVQKAVDDFIAAAKANAPEKYALPWRIDLEVHYNEFHPFMYAWILYLLCAIFMISHIITDRKSFYKVGWILLLGGFALHAYGMVVRVILSGRPPVSNMYETVVWVPWGTLLFAMILERTQKWKLLIPAATCVAILCLILTDIAPSVLDASIQPLEPVLRSTFWLSTHVLIITISYAAFFLAFALGDLLMFYYLSDEKKYAKQIQNGTRSIYRSIQIGVVLLAAGIILGGVWADYSWGRFWGWDPKETWALIALLGYIAILHGRLVGWIQPFALAAWSVIAFGLVIMAWYGVNFVLGAGLHSYGFGAGGVEYVSAFVAAHILFVAYVATVRHSRLKAKPIN